jgi:hypothetical protein
VLLALGVSAILLYGLQVRMVRLSKAASALDSAQERQTLRNYLRQHVSCPDTLKRDLCVLGLVPMTKRNSDQTKETIVTDQGAGSKFGRYTVRAECDSNVKYLDVRVAKLQAGATLRSTLSTDFLPDSFGKIVTWNDAKSQLFPPGSELCSKGNRPVDLTRKNDYGIIAGQHKVVQPSQVSFPGSGQNTVSIFQQFGTRHDLCILGVVAGTNSQYVTDVTFDAIQDEWKITLNLTEYCVNPIGCYKETLFYCY